MMNNISCINNYLSENTTKKYISSCDRNKQYCLSSILYYINKYIWNFKEKSEISEINLVNKYLVFINNNCPYNAFQYLSNTNNLKPILSFIYETINNEITSVNNNPSQNYYIPNHPYITNFLNQFHQNNKSIISDCFSGIFIIKKQCQNCIRGSQILINNYINDHDYSPFYFITFDINTIKSMMNINFSYNNFVKNQNFNLNLNNCFDYLFKYNNNRDYQLVCKNCNQTLYNNEYNIFKINEILTIILYNNENNNIILQDELDLKQYSNNYYGDGIYNLISVLCQISYNQKFICYCVNPYNGLWYSYTDGKIIRVQKMDINAIPLILIYQYRGNISYIYNPIKRDDFNKICLNIRFQNGIQPMKLFFNKDISVKKVKLKIVTILSSQNKGDIKYSLLINGNMTDDNINFLNIDANEENVYNITAIPEINQ